MGQCASDMSVEEQKDMEKEKVESVKLDQTLSQDNLKESKVHKLLLLGAGESGKSTLFKQMVTIYGKGFSDKDRSDYKVFVYNNTVQSMQTLVEQSDLLDPVVGSTKIHPDLAASKRYVLDLKVDQIMNEEAAQHISALWKDPGVRRTFANASKFQLLDSASYFFDRVLEIGKENYIPSIQDVFRTRVRTTGIIEYEFAIENNRFRMFDVGGQRNERKKWIHCFERVTAVIFVASISCYDQMLYEDESVNRMHEALNVFEEICNSNWFMDTAMILFLNKHDIFLEKAARVPLSVCFPEYTGDNKPETMLAYIQEQFQNRNKNDDKQIYAHVTTATNTDNIRHVFDSVKDIVVRRSLNEAGLIR